jgi:hypothetical protein
MHMFLKRTCDAAEANAIDVNKVLSYPVMMGQSNAVLMISVFVFGQTLTTEKGKVDRMRADGMVITPSSSSPPSCLLAITNLLDIELLHRRS